MPNDRGAGRARAELIARLENLLAESAMGYTERFEHQAEQFYRETGFMAPGKSVPLEMYQTNEHREAEWSRWQERKRTQFQQDLRDLLAGLGEPVSPPQTVEETVVMFRIRPVITEDRWRALHDAALAAGAVHAHINPPQTAWQPLREKLLGLRNMPNSPTEDGLIDVLLELLAAPVLPAQEQPQKA